MGSAWHTLLIFVMGPFPHCYVLPCPFRFGFLTLVGQKEYSHIHSVEKAHQVSCVGSRAGES